jgi:hypothetical protein
MTDSIILNNTVNSVIVSAPGPQGPTGPAGTGGGGSSSITVTYPIVNTGTSSAANIGLSASYIPASATYAISASTSASTTQTNFPALTISGSNVATQAYVLANIPTISSSSLYSSSAGTSASLNGIISSSYALQSYANSASLNAYNTASTLVKTGIWNNTNASVNYAISAGSAITSTSATYSANLDGYAASAWALLDSPSFTGTPLAPTAASNVSNTQIATTAYVNNAVTQHASLSASTGYLGYFYQTDNVTLTQNTASAVPWNRNGVQNGFSYNGSSVTFVYPGYYTINYNIQVNGGGNGHAVNAWYRKNGVDIPNTNYEITLSNQAPAQLIQGVYTGYFSAGDILQVMVLLTGGTGTYLWGQASAVGPPAQPATPAAILNIELVTYVQSASTVTYAYDSASLGGIISSSYALQSYANSASLNAYNQASAFSVTTATSASLNSYNNASAFAVIQSNSASLNSYNLGGTYSNSASLNAYNLGVSYSNSASSNAYNSASTYANSASSNAYNLGVTYSNSASLNSYNNASAFSATQSNSASLNAYNSASTFTKNSVWSNTNASVLYSTSAGSAVTITGTVPQSNINNPTANLSYWAPSTSYNKGDLVLYDYKVWRRTNSGTSSSTWSADLSNWFVIWKDQVYDYILPTAGVNLDIFPRNSMGTRQLTNRQVIITWFVATQNISVASVSHYTSTAAVGGTSSAFYVGVYQPSDISGNYSYGSTVNPYAKCLARATCSSAAFFTTGAFTTTLDSSVTLTAGQVYGIGFLADGGAGGFSTQPSIAGTPGAPPGSSFSPPTGSQIANQTGITKDSNILASGGITNTVWARLSA